jgi:uncharacterized protein (DUF433 family)
LPFQTNWKDRRPPDKVAKEFHERKGNAIGTYDVRYSTTPTPSSACNRAGGTLLLTENMSSGNSVVIRNPKILGGTPVFRGTRVPLQFLFDWLEKGRTLEQFLEEYPTVSREIAVGALELAQQLLVAQA